MIDQKTSESMEMTALIVDDEEDIGLITGLMLKSKGIVADYASRVKAAQKHIREKLYDFFILDLHLPDGSGFDLIPEIKKQQPEAEIIIISAYDGFAEQKKSRDYGVTHFIKKPFKKQDLFQVVDTLTKQ